MQSDVGLGRILVGDEMVDWKNEDLNRGEQDKTMSIVLLSRAIDFGKIHTVAAEMQAQDVQ